MRINKKNNTYVKSKSSINLKTCSFKKTVLPRGMSLYRAVENPEYKFQPEEKSRIKEGRFNKEKQYTFYISNYPIAAILEYMYWRDRNESCFVIQYKLLSDLTLVDFARCPYDSRNNSKNKPDYLKELIIINQHITCPKRDTFNWLYSSTQTIADYYRDKIVVDKIDGISFQTSIAHGMKKMKVYEKEEDPKALLNYGIFKNPKDCKKIFKYMNCYKHQIEEYYKYIDEENSKEDISIERKIRAKNQDETVYQSIFDNDKCKPSLPIFEINL